MSEKRYFQFNAIDIDALHDGDGWQWNDFCQLEAGIVLEEGELTARKICKMFRKWGYLSQDSAGSVHVDFSTDECIEIQSKGSGKPLFALSQLHGDWIPESLRM